MAAESSALSASSRPTIFTINDIIQCRIALGNQPNPSAKLKSTLELIDELIHDFFKTVHASTSINKDH